MAQQAHTAPTRENRLNIFLQFKDADLEMAYKVCHRQKNRPICFFAFVSISSSILAVAAGVALKEAFAEPVVSYAQIGICAASFLLTIIALLLSSWIAIDRYIPDAIGQSIAPGVIDNSAFLATCLAHWVLFVHRNLVPKCAGQTHFETTYLAFTCSADSQHTHAILYQAVVLLLTLVVTYINLPSLSMECVWGMLTLNLAAISAALAPTPDGSSSMVTMGFWVVLVIASIADLRMRNVAFYFAMEKERLQRDQFSTDLRHIIANVAHDLKTPLSSFTSGLDVLSLLLKDMLDLVARHEFEQLAAMDRFPISDCLNNIKCTTTFMLMAINRCLDSTKANDNMKLTPKYESVSLVDTVTFPLSIMRSVQSKIALELTLAESMQGVVTAHVITDKQWLQENILCYLSNAVKYSAKGVVSLKVSLIDSQQAIDSLNDPTAPELGAILPASTPITTSASASKHHSEQPQQPPTTKCLLFEVEDEGIGIDSEAQKRLFKPFQKSQQHAGGTGLGLFSLAKRVTAIKGRYGVRNRSDHKQGSVFWFAIPYSPDEVMSGGKVIELEGAFTVSATGQLVGRDGTAAAVSVAADQLIPNSPPMRGVMRSTTFTSTNSGLSTVTNGATMGDTPFNSPRSNIIAPPRLKVLLVDDTPLVLKMTRNMLKMQNCEVFTAESGVEAVESIENFFSSTGQHHDLIFMDMQMPVMDGLETTRRIRTLGEPALRHLVIVGLSANSDEEAYGAARDAGMDHFIAKPLTMEKFQHAIKKLRLVPDQDAAK